MFKQLKVQNEQTLSCVVLWRVTGALKDCSASIFRIKQSEQNLQEHRFENLNIS